MARLPTPGGDDGTWGTVLNDFLQQAHEADGTLSDGVATGAVLGSDVTKTTSLIRAGFPTATQIPAGQWAIYKDSTNGTLRVWANDAGTLKSAPLVNGGINGPISLNVLDYGADPTGVTECTAAFNAAINALPAEGGVVFVPFGDYKIDGTIDIGNGTSTSVSTRQGVVLMGAVPPGIWIASNPLNPSGLTRACTRLFTSVSTAAPMIRVNGPMQGWGIHNMELDGVSLRDEGLSEFAIHGGESSNINFYMFRTIAHQTNTYANSGALLNHMPNHANNRYTGWHIRLPNIDGATGIRLDGQNGVASSDSWGNIFTNVYMNFSGPLSGTNVAYGIYLRNADNNQFFSVFFAAGGDPTGSARFICVYYDYNNIWGGVMPADNRVDVVDFYHAHQTSGLSPVALTGTPTVTFNSRWHNRITRVASANGRPPNPGLANLIWEEERAVLVKSVAGGAGTTTLTTNECEPRILEFTGALTGNRIITVVNVSGKGYTIFNNTTGAFTLTVQGASGTGVAIGQGKRARVYSDGTNIVRETADV